MAARNPRYHRNTKQADEDLVRLRKEYDPNKGGYNIEVEDTSVDDGDGDGDIISRLTRGYEGLKKKKTKTIFIKSDFKPEEGGYYADKSHLNEPVEDIEDTSTDSGLTSRFPGRPSKQKEAAPDYKYYDADRVSGITGDYGKVTGKLSGIAGRFPNDGGAIGRDLAKSARKPYKRVSPDLRRQRQSKRRQRAIARGRQSTVLTGTLGGVDDDKRKKTILG